MMSNIYQDTQVWKNHHVLSNINIKINTNQVTWFNMKLNTPYQKKFKQM